MTTPETHAGQAVRSTPLLAAYRDPRIFIQFDNPSENPAEFCELCHDTGYYGDNGPGIKGNREYQPCECNTMYRCRRILARREIAAANAAGQGAAKPYPAPACSPLPPCALCGRTEYPVEYGPRQNPLPAGSLVGFDNGERVWICRRCSRDPAALERLETDASLSANKSMSVGGTASGTP